MCFQGRTFALEDKKIRTKGGKKRQQEKKVPNRHKEGNEDGIRNPDGGQGPLINTMFENRFLGGGKEEGRRQKAREERKIGWRKG